MKQTFDENRLQKSVKQLSVIHPFLSCFIKEESGHLWYELTKEAQVKITICSGESDYLSDYQKALSYHWNIYEEGLLKVFVYPKREGFELMLVIHHLLCDGRASMQLLEDLVQIYSGYELSEIREPQLISSIKDLPNGSDLTGIPLWYVKHLNEQWRKEQKCVSYQEYQTFLSSYTLKHPIGLACSTVNEEKLKNIVMKCRKNNVTVNSLILSALHLVTGQVKFCIGVDVRKKLSCYREKALGNYASGITVRCPKGKSKNCYAIAARLGKHINISLHSNAKEMIILACYLHMDESLIDAMVIASKDYFPSKVAKQAGNMLGYGKQKGFGVTNLGKYQIEGVEDVVFLPPMSPANEQTIGIVTVNGKMNLCDAYDETIKSKEEIQTMLTHFLESMEA